MTKNDLYSYVFTDCYRTYWIYLCFPFNADVSEHLYRVSLDYIYGSETENVCFENGTFTTVSKRQHNIPETRINLKKAENILSELQVYYVRICQPVRLI